jgi:hypothetical protein
MNILKFLSLLFFVFFLSFENGFSTPPDCYTDKEKKGMCVKTDLYPYINLRGDDTDPDKFFETTKTDLARDISVASRGRKSYWIDTGASVFNDIIDLVFNAMQVVGGLLSGVLSLLSDCDDENIWEPIGIDYKNFVYSTPNLEVIAIKNIDNLKSEISSTNNFFGDLHISLFAFDLKAKIRTAFEYEFGKGCVPEAPEWEGEKLKVKEFNLKYGKVHFKTTKDLIDNIKIPSSWASNNLTLYCSGKYFDQDTLFNTFENFHNMCIVKNLDLKENNTILYSYLVGNPQIQDEILKKFNTPDKLKLNHPFLKKITGEYSINNLDIHRVFPVYETVSQQFVPSNAFTESSARWSLNKPTNPDILTDTILNTLDKEKLKKQYPNLISNTSVKDMYGNILPTKYNVSMNKTENIYSNLLKYDIFKFLVYKEGKEYNSTMVQDFISYNFYYDDVTSYSILSNQPISNLNTSIKNVFNTTPSDLKNSRFVNFRRIGANKYYSYETIDHNKDIIFKINNSIHLKTLKHIELSNSEKDEDKTKIIPVTPQIQTTIQNVYKHVLEIISNFVS